MAKSDEEVWALAEKVNTPEAYGTYWKRFRQGVRASEAVHRFWTLQGIKEPPPVPVVPPMVGPTPTQIVSPLPPSAVDACAILITDRSETGQVTSPEGQAFLDARKSNRPADYSAFASKYPQGACRERAEGWIQMRARLRASYSTIPGFGPLVAQPKTRAIVTEDDYPPIAVDKNEQGRVTAEWDVADDGIVESCHISESSGSAILDYNTCRIITARMRYDPARDIKGTPVRSTDHMTMSWALSGPVPPPAPAPLAPH